ncbi:serine/threonine-protein kinase atm [Holotrichia oblita]|uniref:Serine/threonine-protein kinase atm n=1 Tax=Holotrichia oblita TaxID=644536 RepID=A0ACB9T598_HOLOL|nr:serine/threonine-protein kinase atm [Holotrichia oblita]
MLLKLTQSADKEISTEAARCLGELGPLDLASLMLQLGQPHQYPESTPFQLMTSHVVKLLSNYIIDVDIELVKAASDALYGVLESKEGKYYIDNLEDDSMLSRDYLYPFLSKRRASVTIIRIDKKEFQENVNRGELWFADGQNHNIWIKNLACELLKCFSDKCYIHKLIPICKIKVDFCEELLPHIIHLVISDGVPEFVRCLTTQINNFFENVWRNSSQACYDKKTSVQTMLNIIHFLRLNYKKTSQLQLDYLKLAYAAYYCSNFYAAVLYAELWSTQTNTVNPGGCTILEKICETETADITKTMLNVLKHSYTALGDLDALYGCNFSDNTDPENWLEHFKQLEKWDQVSLDYDVDISNGQANKIPELMNSLKRSGYCYLAANCDNSWSDYECLWRLNKFDNDNIKAKPIDLYEKYKYEGLKQLKEDDHELFTVAIENARQFVIETIRCTSLESITDLYSCLTKLQSIQELEDAERAKRDLNFPFLLHKWKVQDSIDKVDFKSVEPIRAQRISILNIFAGNNYDNLKKPLLKSYLHLAESARTEGYFNVANRSIKTLLDVTQESQKYGYLGIFEEAQICWAMGNKIRAKYLIKHLLKITGDDPRLKFASLKLYGMWMAETRSENPDIILNNYFLESLKSLKGIDLNEKDKQSIFKTYDIIARFTDAEYQRILSYIKSAEFERKVKNMEKSKQTAGMIESQSRKLDYDQRKAITIHKKQSLIDETEIENTYKEKNVYWILAMKYYLISLQNSDISNIRAFRILSLLLENRTLKGSDNPLTECLSKIPSYKFISILPQLAPHLTNNSNDEFGNFIIKIIERCAKDHPHHTLPIILALVNSNKDNIFSKSNAATESNEVRVQGAQALLEKLKQDAPEIKNIIQEMEFVCDALIQFAYTAYESCQDTKKKDTYLIPSNMKILKIKNYSKVLLPTCTLNVRKSCRYDDITGIYSYNKEFGKVGGINNPKRLYCRGTDGVVRSQLLKGKDDLRQDAVMEQVFENINELLRANKQTRHLLIRTYKVVPLSKRSGILEWVEGSIRIGDYLLQAHSEHNPKDWKADACRVAMLQVAKKSSHDKLKKFKEICENFKPVFHKFFESNYLEPLVWYDRRKAYMYSVATTSMCGYILGLGDRHLQNILLDEYTAEVIHIDFGIAFEQGRVLPTPETVPFRLTRDIEDGMGMTGIEGIFRKSCERTMEVMRNNHETIITILEVLLYDPLYEWTVSPAEAYSMQICQENDNDNTSRIPGSEEEAVPINVSAERALLRVKQKLHGTEEGGTSSVEGQVEKLLQQARDPSNLSRLYVGWQPFL